MMKLGSIRLITSVGGGTMLKRRIRKQLPKLVQADALFVVSLASINFAIAYAIIKRARRQ